MRNSMLIEIIEWNRARNDLKFDPTLEAKMLSEEAHEFFTAPSLAERCREAADFDFVLVGTLAKYYAQQYQDASEVLFAHSHFVGLRTWAEDARAVIHATLEREFATMGYEPEDVDHILDVCLRYVLEANQAKSAEKNAEGKVVKGSNYVSPSERIGTFIRKLLEDGVMECT